jgi:energy-coupling factor transporter ATP-binding protein EcfA2
MRFITSIRIRDFRSIAAADVEDLRDIVPVVGLNGSGKSNLMRALNLFFTGQVERQSGINLQRDFREPGRKVKRRVAVEVDLDYSVFEDLRQDYLDALRSISGGARQVTIRKEWTVEPGLSVFSAPLGETVQPLRPDQLPAVDRVLGMVRFRYLPNHVHPSRILENEENEIRGMLFARLRRRQVLQEQTVKEISAAADELMQPIIDVMKRATGEVSRVELATPRDWRELAWAFGMKLRGPQSQAFDALVHGSGVQSVLAYSILHAVDTSFLGSFGWRKGAVWALEEPESFLHVGLQEELARLLASYTEKDPLQILVTTHATPFLGISDKGLLTQTDAMGRTEMACVSRKELVNTAFTSRIAPWAHALHVGPPKPMLLVEGVSDRDLLLRAYEQSGIGNPYQILALPDLHADLQGGDDIPSYLKYNAPALAARPDDSPVFVLRDWESGPKPIAAIQSALSIHSTSRCFSWPLDLTNSDLSERFVGIEKFLSTSFIEHVGSSLGLPLLTPRSSSQVTWRYDVNRSDLNARKSEIHQELADRNNPDDIRPLVAALPWLSRQLAESPPLF